MAVSIFPEPRKVNGQSEPWQTGKTWRPDLSIGDAAI